MEEVFDPEKIQKIMQRLRKERDAELISSLGDFEFVERLGESNLAIVYKAKRKDSKEYVAIKVIVDDCAYADKAKIIERFQREIHVLSMMTQRYDHPNLVKFLSSGESFGRHFYVMDFIAGKDLHSLLVEKGGLEQKRAVEIVTDIGDVVCLLHDNGIIHRDIKPANIMVSEKKNRLIDLGILKIEYDPNTESMFGSYVDERCITAKGSILGTFGYISPEQLLGKPADVRGDIYALGTTVYEAVSGRAPFEDITNEKGVFIASKVLTRDTPRLIDVRSEVSLGLSDVVAKAMSKDPNNRYQSCREFVDVLSEFR